MTVCFCFALLSSLPFLLYQLYSYILPAFSPQERNVALPVMVAVPFLFAAGVFFGFEIVLPAAVHFLQGFDAGSFNQLVQATSYYSFSALIMLAMGLIFQVPLFVVAIARAGIVTVRQLRHNRRYAIVLAALVGGAAAGRRDHDGARDRSDRGALRGRYPCQRAARPPRPRRERARSEPRRLERRRRRLHRHQSPRTMLFDLRSRRRRRVVKTVYLFLALLIGLGLVGFGVGTGGNFGGIFNAGNGGGGSATRRRDYANALRRRRSGPRRIRATRRLGCRRHRCLNVSQLPNTTWRTRGTQRPDTRCSSS